MNRPRILRWLRISFSAVCLLLCVLLIALWVRSTYLYEDAQSSLFGIQKLSLHSSSGGFMITLYYGDVGDFPENVSSTPIKQEYASLRVSHWLLRKEPRSAILGATPSGSAVYIGMPYWLPVILTGAMATAPWIKSRFSLRTLLIGVTLLSLGLGTLAYLFG